VKALLYTRPYTFEYTDVPDPELTDDAVLVRVKACGICGSDVQGATGKTGRRLPPLVMGHEAAGGVEAAGANVKNFRKGDRVCFDSTVYCNACEACRAGLFNRCEKRQVLGVSTPAFKRNGAFAEFVAVPWWIVAPLPEPMTFVKAALLEPVSIGLHAAKRGGVAAGETAVVIGAGTIGLFVIQAAKLLGAQRVIASDVNEFRLAVARRLGADVAVNPSKTDLREAVLGETDGKGAHVAYEAVGYAKTFRDAVSLVRMGGRVTAIGNLEKAAEFDLQELVARELSFVGSYASSGEFRECVDLVASDRIDVMPLVSDVMPLAEGGRAFERLLGGKEDLLKIVLEP
jgi:L-iditol 2-dehydrogenase